MTKHTEAQVRAALTSRVAQYATQIEAARALGVAASHLSTAMNGGNLIKGLLAALGYTRERTAIYHKAAP